MAEQRHGWETTKENIQPLSSGRRMADLVDALPSSTAQGFEDHIKYEEYHLKEAERLLNIARSNGEKEDRLHDWVVLYKYLPQHFPTMTTSVQNMHLQHAKEAIKTFLNDTKYNNDPRYLSILMETLKIGEPAKQIRGINTFLGRKVGTSFADMYIRLAELYDGLGDVKNAIAALNSGIQNNAEPKERLGEMKTHLQDEFAKKFAAQQQEAIDSEPVREFASAVPIYGENNEAVSIRQNLPRAAPTSQGRPQPVSVPSGNVSVGPKKLAVFQDPTGESQRPSQQQQTPVEILPTENVDRENNLEACRWNSKNTELEIPFVPEPQPKMKLFVEDDIVTAHKSANSSRNTSLKSDRALKERKEDPASQDEPFQDNPASDHVFAVPNPVKPKNAQHLPQPKDKANVEVKRFHFRLHDYDRDLSLEYDFIKDPIVYNHAKLPRSRSVLKVRKYKIARAEWEEKKKVEESELMVLRGKVEHLTQENQTLRSEVAQLLNNLQKVEILEERLREQERITERKLLQKEEKNEELMGQLTKMTTTQNMWDSQFSRVQTENLQLQDEVKQLEKQLEVEREQYQTENLQLQDKVKQLEKQLEVEREQYQREINEMKRKCEEMTAYEEVGVKRQKKGTAFVDIDVQSRIQDESEIFEEASLPSSPSQNEDASRFQNYINPTLSIVDNSFNPPAEVSCLNDYKTQTVTKPPVRTALAMVERPSEKDMMNVTPAAGTKPSACEMPAFGLLQAYKPPTKLKLYSSMVDSFSAPAAKPVTSTVSRVWGNPPPAEKRTELVQTLQNLPENKPPIIPVQPSAVEGNDQFRRPALPSASDENAPPPALRKPRRSMILGGYGRSGTWNPSGDGNSSDEETVNIFPRPAGSDMNMSNLTMALNMGPKPVITSTPERERTNERTFRDIQQAIACNLGDDNEDDHQPEPYQNMSAPRASHFSVLNEPNANLSTIQETSCENRSRSTTGSCSSTNTMSTTRFGGSVSSRSSSVPRSASRSTISNGYYSDTNANQ